MFSEISFFFLKKKSSLQIRVFWINPSETILPVVENLPAAVLCIVPGATESMEEDGGSYFTVPACYMLEELIAAILLRRTHGIRVEGDIILRTSRAELWPSWNRLPRLTGRFYAPGSDCAQAPKQLRQRLS